MHSLARPGQRRFPRPQVPASRQRVRQERERELDPEKRSSAGLRVVEPIDVLRDLCVAGFSVGRLLPYLREPVAEQDLRRAGVVGRGPREDGAHRHLA